MSDAKADRDVQVMTRAAWLYYIMGMTQAQIGKRLGLNRIRVNRLLAQAREQGVVQIRINTDLASCVALEGRLCARFGLEEAVVVPSGGTAAETMQAIAVATGSALADRMRDGMSVGVGWGRTLRMSLQSVPRRSSEKMSIVSLIGGLTYGSVMNAYETASHLAEIVGAQCLYVAAPAFADTEVTRDILMEQAMLRGVFARARAVDLALVSVGSLGGTSTMLELGLIGKEEAEGLRRAGAVGDLMAYWIDAEGHPVDHPLNRRVIALGPEDLRAIPCVMLASGGPDKVAVLHAALRRSYADILVTDEETAESVLALAARAVPGLSPAA